MFILSIVRGRKINKILCFICLGLSLIFLILTGGFAATGNDALSGTFLILGAVTGGFSLLYGILWLVFYIAESRKQRFLLELNEVQEGGKWPELLDAEFELPREKLVGAARKSFRN